MGPDVIAGATGGGIAFGPEVRTGTATGAPDVGIDLTVFTGAAGGGIALGPDITAGATGCCNMVGLEVTGAPDGNLDVIGGGGCVDNAFKFRPDMTGAPTGGGTAFATNDMGGVFGGKVVGAAGKGGVVLGNLSRSSTGHRSTASKTRPSAAASSPVFPAEQISRSSSNSSAEPTTRFSRSPASFWNL